MTSNDKLEYKTTIQDEHWRNEEFQWARILSSPHLVLIDEVDSFPISMLMLLLPIIRILKWKDPLLKVIISSATYNHYWEAKFFNKDAIFEVIPVSFCDHDRRLKECKNYEFKENGADQLVDILLNL